MKKYSKFCAIALLAITTMFATLTSCEKTEQLVQTNLPIHDVEKELDSLIRVYGNQSGNSRFNVMSATSSSQIPSGLYMMNIGYRNYYQHLQQYAGECSWTSYALAANMVADYQGKNYPLSHSRVTAIRNATNNNSLITAIESYSRNYESNYVYADYTGYPVSSSSSRFNAIKYMLNKLDDGVYTGHPFMAIVGVSSYSSRGNDIDATNISGKQYWIDGNGGIRHYVVVSAIHWKQGGAGSMVYYYDPMSTSATLQQCNLTRFLDALTRSSSNYNFMSIQP